MQNRKNFMNHKEKDKAPSPPNTQKLENNKDVEVKRTDHRRSTVRA